MNANPEHGHNFPLMGENPPEPHAIHKSMRRGFFKRVRAVKAKHAEGLDAGFLVADAKGVIQKIPYGDATFARGEGEDEYSVTFPKAVIEEGTHRVRNVVISLGFASLVGIGFYVRHQGKK